MLQKTGALNYFENIIANPKSTEIDFLQKQLKDADDVNQILHNSAKLKNF